MFIEDLIIDLAGRTAGPITALRVQLLKDDWTRNFIISLSKTLDGGRGLSTQQSKVFINLIKRLQASNILTESGFKAEDIEQLILSPRHRIEPYQSTVMPKEVRYLGDNKIGFRCKRIDSVIHDIKALGNKGSDSSWKNNNRPFYSRSARMWVVSVTQETLKPIMNIIGKHDFGFDDAVIEYLTLAENSRNATSTFAYDPDGQSIIINTCNNPVIESWVKDVLYGEIL